MGCRYSGTWEGYEKLTARPGFRFGPYFSVMSVNYPFDYSQADTFALSILRFELIEYLEYLFQVFRSDPYPIVLDAVNALIALVSAVYADMARPGLGEKLQSIC